MLANPAGTKSRDIDAETDKIGQPAGIARRALSPNEILTPSKDTFCSTTGLSLEYRILYRCRRLNHKKVLEPARHLKEIKKCHTVESRAVGQRQTHLERPRPSVPPRGESPPPVVHPLPLNSAR
jgi:hypothetical protein